jgi:hypothetical protein
MEDLAALVRKIDPEKFRRDDHKVLLWLVESAVLNFQGDILSVLRVNSPEFHEITNIGAKETELDRHAVRSSIKCLHALEYLDDDGEVNSENLQYFIDTGKHAKDGVYGLLDMLRHEGGVGSSPKPLDIRAIDDHLEPIFIVKDKAHAGLLWHNLDFDARWKRNEISTWYLRNAICVGDETGCEQLIAMPLRRESLVGGLAWKPIVLTFANERLAKKLSSIGLAVTEINGIPDSLSKFRSEVRIVTAVADTRLLDMPEAVLDGWLGAVCRERMREFPVALAWPALVTVAGSLVPSSKDRTNLFCALVGEKGCGKSSAIERATWLLGIKEPVLLKLKSGSAEGMAEKIGNAGSEHRLFAPDELGHLLEKAQIQGASFPYILNTAYYDDHQLLTVAHRKQIDFSCQLSVIGGVVEEKFSDIFGSGSTGGLHDRFIFGQCPSGYQYLYRPVEGLPALTPDGTIERGAVGERPIAVEIDPKVYDTRDQWVKEECIDARVAEHAIRVATICAAFDSRPSLRPADLSPAHQFARYQMLIRKLLRPNPGKNPEGTLAHRFLNYLDRYAPDGQWVDRTRMMWATNAYDTGPTTADRALNSLEFNQEIEQDKQGRKRVLRRTK